MIETISRNILELVTRLHSERELSIFLCGGASPAQHDLRTKLASHLDHKLSRYQYRTYFPEHLFMEVLHGYQRTDLLSLESLLARSVHSVVILTHSPGTLAELGAFASHDLLCNKLLAIIEPKHSRTKSFINLGPLRRIRHSKHGSVAQIPINSNHLGELAGTIQAFVRHTSRMRDLSPSLDLANPIFASGYLLSLVYVLAPLSLKSIKGIVQNLSNASTKEVEPITEAVISTLVREGKLRHSPSGLDTTPYAEIDLFGGIESQTLRQYKRKTLTAMRTDFLNRRYRSKYGGALEARPLGELDLSS